jgi:hypothetical protein
MSPQAKAEATLIEAFPSIDAKVVKAVLVASGGNVEPAFNALLGMSDPSFKGEEALPAPPPRPPRQTQQPMTQLESDELYARQLAEQYDQSSYDGYGSRGRGDPPLPRRRRQESLKPNELYEGKQHSFFDGEHVAGRLKATTLTWPADDLPVIRQNITKGFQETQKTFNKWISDVRKRLDGDEEDPPMGESSTGPQRQNFGPSKSDQLYGIRKSAEAARRSADRERYDSDPRVLDDDFTKLELNDNEGNLSTSLTENQRINADLHFPVSPPQKPARPLANPNLFKPTPAAPPGPVDEVEALYSQPTPTIRQPSPGAGKGGKKWQPLTSVAPNPEAEDNDPFSLGDSDEEQDKKHDLKPEDTERLKKTASESGVSAKKEGEEGALKPAERSGSVSQRNKEAEEILKGDS